MLLLREVAAAIHRWSDEREAERRIEEKRAGEEDKKRRRERGKGDKKRRRERKKGEKKEQRVGEGEKRGGGVTGEERRCYGEGRFARKNGEERERGVKLERGRGGRENEKQCFRFRSL